METLIQSQNPEVKPDNDWSSVSLVILPEDPRCCNSKKDKQYAKALHEVEMGMENEIRSDDRDRRLDGRSDGSL